MITYSVLLSPQIKDGENCDIFSGAAAAKKNLQ